MFWYIDPSHAQVNFSVKHMMVSTVRGRLGRVSGRLQLDPAPLDVCWSGEGRGDVTVARRRINGSPDKAAGRDVASTGAHPGLLRRGALEVDLAPRGREIHVPVDSRDRDVPAAAGHGDLDALWDMDRVVDGTGGPGCRSSGT